MATLRIHGSKPHMYKRFPLPKKIPRSLLRGFFISLILLSHMNKVMTEKNMYRDMTLKEMLLILKKLRLQTAKRRKPFTLCEIGAKFF
jgi:hypothetical protein